MSMGLIGRKEGMTRVFMPDGVVIPVTCIRVLPHFVTQIKTPQKEGYAAVQVTTGSRKTRRMSRAEKFHFSKVCVAPGRGLWEFVVSEEAINHISVGHQFDVGYFEQDERIKVSGLTHGKGYAGVIKRHNFRSQDATHGNSLSHRAPGSIGQCQFPGRVFKGKKMSGRMGNNNRTISGLSVIRVDVDHGFLLVKGAVPGPKGGMLRMVPMQPKAMPVPVSEASS